MKQSYFFISREEAMLICDKSQYSEASLWEKIKLNFRYIWCKYTRRYVIDNRKLTRDLKKADMHCLTPEELYNLKHEFNAELKNHKQN